MPSKNAHKLLGGHNVYLLVGPQREEVIIMGDEIVDARFDRAGQHHIVLGIAAHPAEAGKLGDKVDRSSKCVKKFHDLLIGVAIASLDAFVLQEHACCLLENLLGDVEVKNSSARMLEELG
jgi:hypothetical protein